jgi:hypothetical protein
MACVLALAALRKASGPNRGKSVIISPVDVLKGTENGPW